LGINFIGEKMKALSRLSIFLLLILCTLGFVSLKGFHSQLQAQVLGQTPAFPPDKTVIDMTSEELLQYYSSELRGIEFSQNQDQLGSLLQKTGQRVQEFYQEFSNTSSKEYVLMQMLGFSGKAERSHSRDFNYMMIYHPDDNKPLLEEYRTDKKNQPIDQEVIQGYFLTSGYAAFSLNFHPKYQPSLRFRYLGRQRSKARAHLIAFVQKPEIKDLMIAYTNALSGKTVRLPVQGIAWIDPGTYQILRLRINLLGLGNSSMMTEQTADIQFSEVNFAELQKPMLMLREVVVVITIANQVFRNYHRYSDYKLFSTSSTYTLDKPKLKN
jgi:hypothetical protein